MKPVLIILVLVLLLFPVSCSQKSADNSSSPTRTLTIDPTTAATITGVVKFEGTPPTAQKIDMSQDPACGSQPNLDPSVVIQNGNLANVFVYVKDLVNDSVDSAPTDPVVITQRGCRYEPHVAAVRVGQPVHFDNADSTTHNVHMMPAKLHQWNESQMPSAPPIERRFDQPEVMIPIKCNQHPWMRMYLSVMANHFFAITGTDGRFEIRGLPPGTYTLAAIHERFGEQDVKVTVGPKESETAAFTFKDSGH